MKLNKGDLCVIVNALSQKQHIGKVVRLTSRFDFESWNTEPTLTAEHPFNRRRIAWLDAHLRPLRDSDGTDETLTWKDVPSEVTA